MHLWWKVVSFVSWLFFWVCGSHPHRRVLIMMARYNWLWITRDNLQSRVLKFIIVATILASMSILLSEIGNGTYCRNIWILGWTIQINHPMMMSSWSISFWRFEWDGKYIIYVSEFVFVALDWRWTLRPNCTKDFLWKGGGSFNQVFLWKEDEGDIISRKGILVF